MHGIWTYREANHSLIGTRTHCIREKEAPRRAPSKLCTQRPGFRKDPGLFHFNPQPLVSWHRLAIHGSHHRFRWTLFNNLPRDDFGTGRRSSCIFADVRVRGSSSAPLRVCPFTPLPRDMVLAARDVRDSRPEPRAARHHIRRDARVGAQPKWIQCRVRLVGPGHHSFKVDTRVRTPHATPDQEALTALALWGEKSAASIGRRRNP